MEIIQRPILSDVVASQIIKLIQEQDLKVGDKLPSEPNLTKALGIGRTSVREAIKKLEGLGLLTSRQGYGVILNEVTIETLFKGQDKSLLLEFVEITQKDVSDWLELRFLIESEASRLAAERIDTAGLKKLENVILAADNSLGSTHEFAKYDTEFHNIIVSASQNNIYGLVHNLIRDLFFRQRESGAHIEGAMETVVGDHKRIFEAIKSRDSHGAEDAMRKHLITVRTIWGCEKLK
ncbi:MAG: FadR family transcriptional regulator [Desulfobacterales bacterium]|nr:FadR family transcriptional regulator [Desulfobacterales bacterium]